MIELNKSGVRFLSDTHQYFLDGVELKGITSTLIKRAFPDDYKGIPEEVLRKAADRGSNVHETIELYEDLDADSDLPELGRYKLIKIAHKIKHVASEYIVTDGKHYASAIDHVFTDEDGGIIIVDVKTTYSKHYEKVALQLSILKRFFEMQNPHLKVAKCALIWLRGEDSEYQELTPWAEEPLNALIEADINDMTFDLTTTYGDLPTKFAEVESEIAQLEIAVKEAKKRQDALKKGLYDLMESHNVKSFTGSRVKLTRVLPTTSTTFDSKALKEDNKEIYEKYIRKTPKSGSLKITLL